MSDNAQEFRSAAFQATITGLGARHRFIRAGRPQTNGCIERVQQTILDECWKPAFARYLIPKQTGLRLDLDRYLRYYNTRTRPHRPLDQRPHAEEVLGKAKLWQKR
jgi:transposase InsO family protein